MAIFRAWHSKNVRLAVTGLAVPAGLSRDMVAMHVFDAATVRKSFSEKALLEASRSGTKLFARGIGSMELFEWCAAVGFSYFTFGGLDSPEYGGQSKDSSRLPLMRLLSLVAADADAATMEEVLKLDPKLAFELLRLVNSTSIAPARRSPVCPGNHGAWAAPVAALGATADVLPAQGGG